MRDAVLIIISATITSLAMMILEDIPETQNTDPVEAWLVVDELDETETIPTQDETEALFLFIDRQVVWYNAWERLLLLFYAVKQCQQINIACYCKD